MWTDDVVYYKQIPSKDCTYKIPYKCPICQGRGILLSSTGYCTDTTECCRTCKGTGIYEIELTPCWV